ncbi:uncharacterized protein dbf4b [Genypterus blacodes]|uniref:uncharacterized protein dbf4b n=1 Tax=Genypterus blacodes TaxID=154954 RepID=UPI003F75BB6E
MQQLPETRGLLGDLCPGHKRLDGKSFYLDGVKSRPTALLVEAISLLGGRVESFLHKDVSFVVTGSRESPKEPSFVVINAGTKAAKVETHCLTKQKESFFSNVDKPRPGTPRPMVCGSRGKALLEKAIRNNERLRGSSVLANAQSWGVKILYVDDVLSYLKQLTRESFSSKHKRTERPYSRQQVSPLVKASALRPPYLKVEDSSRKYKPLHMQSMTFPSVCYSSRYSPFATPPPPLQKLTDPVESTTREKKKAADSIQDKSPTPLSFNPSPWRPRKKDLAYCEACQQPFTQLEEHLQSDQHRQFVLDSNNYNVLDQLVAGMRPGFDLDPSQDKNRLPTPSPIPDVAICELEPLTDAETEDAVQALLIQGSSFNTRVPNPMMSSFSSVLASSLPGVQCLTPNPTIPPANTQHFTPITDCQLPDSRPSASGPAVPSLDAASLTPCSASRRPDTQSVSPCPDIQCLPSDPYDLPPVLSPQILDPSQVLEAHSPYSEPPVLSPQQYIEDGHTDETETLDIVSQFIPAVTFPISTPLISSIGEEKEGSKQPLHLPGLSRLLCPDGSLEVTELALRRSHSLPWLSETTWNPKKRCRSFSLELNTSKRRRTSAAYGQDASWSGEVFKCFTKSQSAKGGVLFEVSCTGGTYRHRDSILTVEQGGHESPRRDSTLIPQVSPSSGAFPNQDCQPSLSTSVCIEPALIPDLSPSSSDSDWDCELLSRFCPTPAAGPFSAAAAERSCPELDKEILQRPCTWMHDTSYESHLHTVLQPATSAPSLCGEEMDSNAFSRTLVQIVEVQH